jgi:hypothetical protein
VWFLSNLKPGWWTLLAVIGRIFPYIVSNQREIGYDGGGG